MDRFGLRPLPLPFLVVLPQALRLAPPLEDLSFEIATPDEAHAMLDTKGSAHVGF